MRVLLFSILYFLVSASALADDQNIQQSGNVTAGHVPVWIYNQVLGDGGPATNGNITELGLKKNGGLPFCISTADTTDYTVTPYSQLCLSISDTLAFLSVQGYGEATPAFCIYLNGVCYPVNGGGGATALRVIASGTIDSASLTDQAILWDSASAGVKSEILPSCDNTAKGLAINVVDEIGTADTYPIGLIPNNTDTIRGKNIYYISLSPFGSTRAQCDGSGNWVVE